MVESSFKAEWTQEIRKEEISMRVVALLLVIALLTPP
jgi:hypothetical protein